MQIDEIVENFEFLDDWEDRYKYLIELGNGLAPLADSEMTPQTRVQGCVSQVWLVCEEDAKGDSRVLTFRGNSDAHIVRGLIAVTLAIYSGRRADEILAIDENSYFQQIGLQEHITPQRSNGLRSMVERIKSHAKSSISA